MYLIVFTCSMAFSFCLTYWQKKKETLDFKLLFYIFMSFVLFFAFSSQPGAVADNLNGSKDAALPSAGKSAMLLAAGMNILCLIIIRLFAYLENMYCKTGKKSIVSKSERMWLYIATFILALIDGYLMTINGRSGKEVFTPYVVAFFSMIVIQLTEYIGKREDVNELMRVIKGEWKRLLYILIVFVVICLFDFNAKTAPLTIIHALCFTAGYFIGIVVSLNPE
ncbi:hypothetical protein [Oribacterium sp. P6A1]|uniref:hypothetical protein n=1 Tax=Oribacterium sp. P6A1 TaxID=1410612 RepID=UPI00055BF0E1|nr:hypothetical protein [Oribacterium sp. P6A1]